jgi:hypothetical protein
MSRFDPEAAVRYLNAHAGATSGQYCARYTRNAVNAGFGVAVMLGVTHAKDHGFPLQRAGFKEVPGIVGLSLNPGDVVVIQGCPGHPSGHMAMWTGTKWVSDFRHNHIYPSAAYRKHQPSYRVYRHPDATEYYTQHRGSNVGFRGILP